MVELGAQAWRRSRPEGGRNGRQGAPLWQAEALNPGLCGSGGCGQRASDTPSQQRRPPRHEREEAARDARVGGVPNDSIIHGRKAQTRGESEGSIQRGRSVKRQTVPGATARGAGRTQDPDPGTVTKNREARWRIGGTRVQVVAAERRNHPTRVRGRTRAGPGGGGPNPMMVTLQG
jgi:hypothetical protein